jgi:tetratricopeptide (TPR) repeat protein
MNIMRIMGPGLLMALWLTMGVCSGGGLAEKTYYQALEQGMQGNFPQAQETLVRALGADPFYAPAKVCLETLQDVTTKKIKPQTAIHVFTAMAYGNHSQWEEFIAEINRALQLDPEYGAAYNHRGNAYDESGQYDRAVADFDQAVALNPSFAEAHFNKAMACEQAGRPQDAAAAYRSFLHYAIDS